MEFDRADGKATVDERVVHVSRQITTDFIPAIFVPVLHLSKTEQEREQDGDTADGLADVGGGLDVHDEE